MKKIFSMMMAVVAAFGITASAQQATEYNVDDVDGFNRSGLFVEIGAGATCGDLDSDLGMSVGLGYRYHLGSGFNWDILKVSYYNPSTTEAFEEGSSMRFLTGVRYNSAPVLAGHPIYAAFGLGYQLNVENTDRWKGFAYEIGAGVTLSRTCSLGIMWEGNVAYEPWWNHGDNGNFGIIGLKLGFLF